MLTIVLIVAAFFAVCWLLGALSNGKGILGFLANLVIWIVRKAWLILALLVVVAVAMSIFAWYEQPLHFLSQKGVPKNFLGRFSINKKFPFLESFWKGGAGGKLLSRASLNILRGASDEKIFLSVRAMRRATKIRVQSSSSAKEFCDEWRKRFHRFVVRRIFRDALYWISSKSATPCLQRGQTKSSGRLSPS